MSSRSERRPVPSGHVFRVERKRGAAWYATYRVVMHGVLRRAQHVWDLPSSPVDHVEKYRHRASGGIDVFSPDEVMALVRAVGPDRTPRFI